MSVLGLEYTEDAGYAPIFSLSHIYMFCKEILTSLLGDKQEFLQKPYPGRILRYLLPAHHRKPKSGANELCERFTQETG